MQQQRDRVFLCELRRAVVVFVVVVTCGEQNNYFISDGVKREIDALVNRNRDEPVQRLAEVTAIKEVIPIPHDDDDDDHNLHKNCNNWYYNNNHHYDHISSSNVRC